MEGLAGDVRKGLYILPLRVGRKCNAVEGVPL
jgi:hypothetical protein